jgi:E3 ubiquitin-protein ligase SIAH1
VVPAQCELIFSRYGDGSLCLSHYHQKSDFQVACTDLSDGLPALATNGCFRFVMPNSVLGDDDNTIEVKARITIS